MQRWFLLVAFCWVVGCGADVNQTIQPEVGNDQEQLSDPIQAMQRAVSDRNWDVAWEMAPRALLLAPDDPAMITEVAVIAARMGRTSQAADLMVQAARHSDFDPQRVEHAIQALIDVGRLYDVIDLLQDTVQANPSDHLLRVKLIGFLKEAQRNELIEPHYQTLIRKRHFDLQLLVALTDAESRTFSTQTVQWMIERNPDDRRVRMGEAIDLKDNRKFEASRDVCREILDRHPDFAPAQALLGYVLAAQQLESELVAWIAHTSEHCKEQVDYWLALGSWWTSRNEHAHAARAFHEATRRDPNSSVAWAQLATSMRVLQNSADKSSDSVSEAQLNQIDQRVQNLLLMRKDLSAFTWSEHKSQRIAVEIAKSLSRLGRNWEAEAWAAVATTLADEPVADLAGTRTQIVDRLKRDQRWQSTTWNHEFDIDLSHLPMPATTPVTTPVPDDIDVDPQIANIPTDSPRVSIRLGDESGRWGLTGLGADSDPDDDRRGALTRSTGVGGGAIDYDLDGWSDVVVMGAGGEMLQSDSHPNELLRNDGDRLLPVSKPAGIAYTDFGQGCCVGDFNEDGFPDLFFANLGANRLLRNNGDGSFSNCDDLFSDETTAEWTTCAAFVDINRDGISDLVTGNYCSTAGDPDRPCPNESGKLGTCHPLRFRAQANRLYLADACGRFSEVTDRLTDPLSSGRTMGVLAGMLIPDTLGIFFANDMSPNELLTQTVPAQIDQSHTAQSQTERSPVRLDQTAVARGVAVDAASRPQASMGIAASDFDGDGDLDLYVTGFANEYNIYYEQVSPGFWSDRSGKVGLLQPTLATVGFGTEAIDLDGDGSDEIVVTNGHIGEFDDGEYAYEQPFQIFKRRTDGMFVLLDDDDWGDYFSRPHVGRALWTIDINGDHRNDVMITHTREHARLLINQTPTTNRHLSFRLIGRECARDATGAIVRFSHDGKKRSLWCLSGDGYMCSNERILRAGVGSSDEVNNVHVIWPDGSVDRIGNLATNTHYLVVQGDDAATSLLRGQK
ncbi:FG-GAP-like repeat-containing protein [Stieleria sp. ICT_E10.1]|uniref:FG-GAP-like repeat-containing protein n=1 Tax=Stieleria sedimenti TaxID=2976331 RepID=UPI0021801B8F|nr:FG-GAP-like repeat-containing protein [Stieleria sedimenti]MCS7465786.1 FG-GAP-like repeat-containing protein [Stieleria sedimenti]